MNVASLYSRSVFGCHICNCCISLSIFCFSSFKGNGFQIDNEPGKAYTWSNHVMNSGQDDVAFLRVLADYIRHHHLKLYLSGHSNYG